jgi:hypothetical protein
MWRKELHEVTQKTILPATVVISTWSAGNKPGFLFCLSPILKMEAKHRLRLSTDHGASYPILNYSQPLL